MTGLVVSGGTITLGTTVIALGATQASLAGMTSITSSNATSWQLGSGAASTGNPTLIPNRGSTTTGFGSQATGNLCASVGGAEITRWVSTGLTIISGKALTLGNAATTGLGAGLLAALTNASIVLTDSAGQAYRIPCII